MRSQNTVLLKEHEHKDQEVAASLVFFLTWVKIMHFLFILGFLPLQLESKFHKGCDIVFTHWHVPGTCAWLMLKKYLINEQIDKNMYEFT